MNENRIFCNKSCRSGDSMLKLSSGGLSIHKKGYKVQQHVASAYSLLGWQCSLSIKCILRQVLC